MHFGRLVGVEGSHDRMRETPGGHRPIRVLGKDRQGGLGRRSEGILVLGRVEHREVGRVDLRRVPQLAKVLEPCVCRVAVPSLRFLTTHVSEPVADPLSLRTDPIGNRLETRLVADAGKEL